MRRMNQCRHRRVLEENEIKLTNFSGRWKRLGMKFNKKNLFCVMETMFRNFRKIMVTPLNIKLF